MNNYDEVYNPAKHFGFNPALAAYIAAVRPAGPPPIITTFSIY